MSNRTKEIDSFFSEWDKSDSPGCVLAVIQNGKIIYERGYGMANLEHGVPLKATSVFRTGSVSKQFTAMCIALLVDQELISLDDGIRKYVPEIPDYADSITIRHMIHHTSGIRNYTSLFATAMLSLEVRHADNIAKSDALEMLSRQQKLNFEPGERYEYSNSNYFLLGLIVERVSDKSLRDFAQEFIFKPLGMTNTHYHDDYKMVVANRAYGYAPRDEGGFEISMSNCEVVGDGCVFSTIYDLFIWDKNFYNNILPGGSELISAFQTPGILNSGDAHDYAFGLVISKYKGLSSISHGGAWAGFQAYIARFPEQKFTVILLANLSSIPVQKLANQVIDVYLKQFFKETEVDQQLKEDEFQDSVTLPGKVLDELVGLYLTPLGSLIEVSRIKSNLSIEVTGMKESRTTYAPISETRFTPITGWFSNIIDVERVDKEKPPRLVFHKKDGVLSKWEQIPKIIPEDEMNEYSGDYYSKELDTTYSIQKTEGGALTVRTLPSWSDAFELYKIREDELTFMSAMIKFRRNKQRKVIGFEFSSAWGIQGILFRKRK
ncbi:MAG: serine hydrolase domain-containing protein [Candidatus Thorarchaeota archaeon]|jgi:CubicO group peptidase (beta-lactamase class C family)